MAEIYVRIVVLGTPDLLRRIEGLQTFHRSARLKALFYDALQKYLELSRGLAPVGTRFLRRSIDGKIEDWGTTNPRIRVYSSADHAGPVEFGAKPHPIFPRVKRWLHWFENGKGQTLNLVYGLKKIPAGTESKFKRSVQHPGNRAQPFLYPPLPLIRARLLTRMEELLNQVAAGRKE